MTDSSRVLVALRVPATVEKTFAAFTEQIGAWWKPNGLFQFTEGRTGTLSFEPGPDGRLVETYPDGEFFVIGDTRVWDPPHHLVVTWRQANFEVGQITELHVRFDDVDDLDGLEGSSGQTRVTVEHFGWDLVPADHAARHGFPLATFQLRFAQWWRTLLQAVGEAAANPIDRS
ncbi:MAG: SRPBCC domain-containing protein [Ilumatobacteraceae bacterium]